MAYTPPSSVALETAADGAAADPEDPPAGEAVRILASVGESASPQVLAVETSQSGKTATIDRNSEVRHRLEMPALLSGDRVERDGYWYELYTPERYRELLDGDRDVGDLPKPTHRPA